MEPRLIELPDAQQISQLVAALTAGSPAFAAALRGGASTAEALARFGLWLCRENRAADAVGVLGAAIALEPGNASSWTNLAAALHREDAPAEAAACLERSLALADHDPAAWLLLGTVRTRLRDPAGAEAAYRAALRRDETSPLAWQCLGLVKQEQGELAAAVECFAACVARGGASAGVLANLGKLCYETGRFAESAEAYAAALELDGSNGHSRQMLRHVRLLRQVLAGDPVDEALTAYRQSLPEVEADLGAVLENAFGVLKAFGHLEAAARVGRKWQELAPGSAVADYLARAVTGGPGVERAPPAYIVAYFDGLAAGFDDKLVKVLRYDVPAQLCSAVERVAGPRRHFDTLDAGCGTGLCGPLLRTLSRELIGVDLSAKMLELARRRGVYDALHCEELIAFLRRGAGCFDLVVTADVLVYFGDLSPVWAAAAEALRPGGLLAFSTEATAGEGYRLGQSGRFAHSLAYLRATSAALFEERTCAETTLREEAREPVRGYCCVLSRR